MKQIMKRLIGIALLLCLLIGVCPAQAFAAETREDSGWVTEYIVNPLYAHLVSKEDIPAPTPEELPEQTLARGEILQMKEAAAVLRQGFKDRLASITIMFQTSETDLVTAGRALYAAAMEHTGAPDEGYYLTSTYYTGTFSIGASYAGNQKYYTVVFKQEYMTTAAQEAEMDIAVDNLLWELDLDGKSDYEKIWVIYNYILDNVSYDYDHLGDMVYRLQQTAYGALVKGTCVCEGYATLLYRLLLTLGVETRVQVGYAGGGLHAWNIIKMGNYWYYADSTWDDPDGWTPTYRYFLVGESGFTDHSRNDEYNTDVYNLLHPVPQGNYALAKGNCGQSAYWVISNDGTLSICGEGEMGNCSMIGTPWGQYKNNIVQVDISEGITSIGECAFEFCKQLTSVTVPDSVKRIDRWALANNYALKNVTFLGSAPVIESNAFEKSAFVAYFPSDDQTWNASSRKSYGGTVTWMPDGGDGWVQIDSQWVFIEDGEYVKNTWVKDGSKWYYMGSDGYMVKNRWVKDGKQWCYLGSRGFMITNGWAKDGNKWCYMNQYGYITYSQWLFDGIGWAYVGSDGYMVTNQWVRDGAKWCYVGSDGYMVKDRWVKDAGKWCYVDRKGYLVVDGWAKDGKVWRFMDSDGYITYSQWVYDGIGWGYVDGNGCMITNQWKKDAGKWCYIGSDGYMVTNKWMKDAGKWCYLGKNGYLVVDGWAKDGNKWCYMNSSGYITYNQWVYDGTGWAFVGTDGYMVTNKWVKDGSKWCYVDGTGYMMKSKWIKYGTSWCYVDKHGYMVTGRQYIDGKWYTFDAYGLLVS